MRDPLYPLFLRLEGRHVLVVGGGEIAARRVKRLLEAGARLTIVAPQGHPDIETLEREGRLTWHRSEFDGGVDAAYTLCIAATSSPEVNRAIALAADASGVACVNAGDSANGSAIVPAVIESHGVVVAISTGGASPALSALIRRRIETALSAEVGEMAGLLERLRSAIDRKGSQSERAAFYRSIATEENLARLAEGRRHEVVAWITREAASRGFGDILVD